MDAFLRFHKLPTWTRDDVNALLKQLNAKETSRGFVENYIAGPSEKALARQKSGGQMTYTYGSSPPRTRANPRSSSARSAASRARP